MHSPPGPRRASAGRGLAPAPGQDAPRGSERLLARPQVRLVAAGGLLQEGELGGGDAVPDHVVAGFIDAGASGSWAHALDYSGHGKFA